MLAAFSYPDDGGGNHLKVSERQNLNDLITMYAGKHECYASYFHVVCNGVEIN